MITNQAIEITIKAFNGQGRIFHTLLIVQGIISYISIATVFDRVHYLLHHAMINFFKTHLIPWYPFLLIVE